MNDKSAPPKDKARAERAARLKQALRANLRRRKQAARPARAEEPRPAGADGPTTRDDKR